jgi:hypothetical protein
MEPLPTLWTAPPLPPPAQQVRNRIHPTNIISGYRLAMREVCGGGVASFAVAAASCALPRTVRPHCCSTKPPEQTVRSAYPRANASPPRPASLWTR